MDNGINGSTQEFLNILKKRRSIYDLGKNLKGTTDDELISFIEEIVRESPTGMNSQTTRVVFAFNDNHDQVWDITLDEVLKSMADAPQEAKDRTTNKIANFKKAYATILFFTDTKTTHELEETMPLYSDNFEKWANQAQGGMQQAIWMGLASRNIGANLQHYNPLIDDRINKLFQIPEEWDLLAQMPFGSIESPADDKSYLPNDERFKIFK